MINKSLFQIFKQGSKTYFYSSVFFPSIIRKDVFILYAFVRKTDNLVDAIPQKIEEFYKFKESYYNSLKGEKTGDIVIDLFIDLQKRKKFEQSWVDAFINSMEKDITKNNYESIEETIEYMYGSAEVVGLMMAKILGLNEESFEYARYLGRSMQYINFIRDIFDDIKLGRRYLPKTELKKYGLESLEYDYIIKNQESFKEFLRAQIKYYIKWLNKAEEGYKLIPKRFLIPVKTASEMYFWTAMNIYKNPLFVYNKKIKPNISTIVSTIVMNLVENNKIYDKIHFLREFDINPQQISLKVNKKN
jgi:phytoene synthase